MPTQDSQVYWHDLPEKVPPWSTVTELRAVIDASQHTSQDARHASSDDKLRPPPRPLPKRMRAQRAAQWRRRAAVLDLEDPAMYFSPVLERHATLLDVVNLVMCHLHQPTVSHQEAEAAVTKVMGLYDTLTQMSQHTAGAASQAEGAPTAAAAASDGSDAPKRRQRSGRGAVAAAMRSVLSQSQHTPGEDPTHATPSASQRRARRGAGLATDMQNSLLLDVVKEFCGATGRALRFHRLTREEIRQREYRITGAELEPHRRVLLLADRGNPYLVALFGLFRTVTPEPFVAETLKAAGRSPAAIGRYGAAARRYTQMFSMVPAPDAWRRISKTVSISAWSNEFVVAVVEVDDSAAYDGGQRTGAAAGGGDRSPPRQQRRTEVLLGAGEEDEEDWLQPRAAVTAAAAAAAQTPPKAAVSSPWASATESLDRRWIRKEPLFTADTAAQALEDPLQQLSKAGLTGAQVRRTVWYRRLIDKRKMAELIQDAGAAEPDE